MPIEAFNNGDPREVGPYVLEGRLGGGGMGSVFLGRSRTGRPVAVKLIHPDLADDAEFRTRFRREVAAARRVGGFWAAQVVDADAEAERPWMATAYVAGPSLQDAVGEEGALPASVVRTLGATLAEGLAAIHAQDLVHRDLKPSNILLAEDGPRVVDFGIALDSDATALTRRGAIGTAPYMSPEQVRGLDVTPASDVFSLGSVLVFACTGRGPFGAGAAEDVARRVVQDEPDLHGVPAGLRDLVESCLAKDPGDRPAPSDVVDRLATTAGGGWELPAGIVAMIAASSADVGGSEAGVVAVSPHDPAATELIDDPGTRAVQGDGGTGDAGPAGTGAVGGEAPRAWWRSLSARRVGIGVAGVAVGAVAALLIAGALTPDEGAGAPSAEQSGGPGVGNMVTTTPNETHEVTLEVSATGKDADKTPVGVRYDGRLGPIGLGDSFRSAEDIVELDLDKMYTEIELPWSKTISARGTVEDINITLTAEAGWRDAMYSGDPDIAVSCRILIDGEVRVEETGEIVVGCSERSEQIQEQLDEAMKKNEKQSAERQEQMTKAYQEQQEAIEKLDPLSPDYMEQVQKILGQTVGGNG